MSNTTYVIAMLAIVLAAAVGALFAVRQVLGPIGYCVKGLCL